MSIEHKTLKNTSADGENRSSSITDLLFFALLFAVVFGLLISIVSSFTTAGILGQISFASTLGYFSTLGHGVGLSMAIVFILILAPLTALHYLGLASAWMLKVVGTCVGFLLIVLQITHHAMHYEFGEGINYRILHLFEGDAMTIFYFLNAAYPIWAFVLGSLALAFITTLAVEKLVGLMDFKRSNKFVGWSLSLLAVWCAYGIYSFNTGGSLQLNNFPKMGEDAYLSSIKTAIVTQKEPQWGYKQYLMGLTPENNATMETAVLWAQANAKAEKPSQAFLRDVPPAPFKLLRKPSHIFILQLESHDGLVLYNEKLRGLSPNLNRFKDTGIYVPHFFEGSGDTNSSIMAILMSYPGLRAVVRQSVLHRINVMNMVDYLTEQGYQCTSHSAAKSDACSHGRFLKYLGFDHISYTDNYEVSEWADSWGISDEQFATDFLQAVNTAQFAKNPQFVFWKNHSNHSPYSVDVISKGFDPSDVSKEHLEFFRKGGYDPAKVAGHYWFADKQVGRVVDEMYCRHPDSLFIITADHYSRYANDPSDPLSKIRLPLIMWGPNIIPQEASKHQNDWYGTHMDVFPSLLSLLSPEQKEYSLYGSPLWDQSKIVYSTKSTGDANGLLLKDQMRFYNFRARQFSVNGRAVTPFLRRAAGVRALSHQSIYSEDKWE